MKRLLVIGMLSVCGVTGCSMETGGSETDPAVAENIGSSSQALIAGTWAQLLLAPHTAQTTTSGYRVCRAGPYAAYPGTPGWMDGNVCRYSASGSAWYDSSYELLEAKGYQWITAMTGCGRGYCTDPRWPARMISSNGVGVCEVSQNGRWIGGHVVGGYCYFGTNNTYGQVNTEAGVSLVSIARVLIKP